jgi:hypothetical protein
MAGFTRFVDLGLTDEEKIDAVLPMPVSEVPDYPYGTRICLSEKEMEKLEAVGCDCDFQVGEVIDIRALGTVTSVSSSDGPNGPCRRAEIQLEKLAVELESEEDIDEE